MFACASLIFKAENSIGWWMELWGEEDKKWCGTDAMRPGNCSPPEFTFIFWKFAGRGAQEK